MLKRKTRIWEKDLGTISTEVKAMESGELNEKE